MLVYFAIVAGFFLLFFLIPRKYSWAPMLLFVIALAIFAYHIVPNENDDIGRYFRIIDALRADGYDRLQEMIRNNEFDFASQPVAGYYYYFISRFPDNHYLPFFTILIAYGLMMLVIYKTANRFNADKFYMAVALFFMISTYWFYDLYSGTRNGLVFAVVLACAYYHLAEKKRIILCFAGYALACGLHSAGIVLVVLVLIAWATYRVGSKYVNVALIFSIIIGSVGITVLSNILDNDFINNLAGKAEGAVSTLGISTQTTFFVNLAVYIVSVLIYAYCAVYIKKYADDKDGARFFRLAEVVLFFLLGVIISNMLFHRIVRWVLPVLTACVYMAGMQLQKDRLDKGLLSVAYDSDTPRAEKIRAMNKGATTFFVFGFSAVHFWYDFTGSSLAWLNLG